MLNENAKSCWPTRLHELFDIRPDLDAPELRLETSRETPKSSNDRMQFQLKNKVKQK